LSKAVDTKWSSIPRLWRYGSSRTIRLRKENDKKIPTIQQIITEWWECWYRTVLPTLVPSYQWLQKHRNVEVGDICLIKYGKEKRANYRLGRVTKVKKGTDGLVRTVELQYKLPTKKKFRTVDRPIHGIAVIVPIEEQGNQTGEVESNLNPEAPEFTSNKTEQN
jgi:hypothetical protein